MKLKLALPLRLLMTATLLLPLFHAQAAKLLLPENVELASVNGKDLGFRLLNQPKHLDLSMGTQLLELRYRDLIESDDDSHQTIRSDDYFLRFYLDKDTTYALICESPSDEEGAWRFSKDPHFTVKEVATGKRIELTKMSIKERKESILDSLMNLGQSEVDDAPKSLEQAQMEKRQVSTVSSSSDAATAAVGQVTAVTSSVAVAAAPAAPAAAAAAPATPDAPEASQAPTELTTKQQRALEMLQYWWQQADQATRQAFMQQLNR